ncbi:hypothetical protein AYO44_05455 [Planctomycetaceae bacterium SCGC AG-212-F19]|nr:hypothetical protein AYO44_05455 [Planctomycetaceae bacterium SCGC AG-212-F19]
MAKVHDLLMHELETGSNPIWLEIWRQHVRETVARRALTLLDVSKGTVRDQWPSLDDDRARRKLLTGSLAVWDSLTTSIVNTTRRNTFNRTLRSQGQRQLNAGQFRAAVYDVVPSLMSRRTTLSIVDENPFPDAWPKLANALAGDLHRRNLPDFSDPEWYLLHGLLLAGFFATCRLPTAGYVAQLFRKHEKVLLSARSCFLRIPERIDANGIVDVPVPLSSRARGPVPLSSAWLSPLVSATVDEINLTLNREGFMHRHIPWADKSTTVPIALLAQLTPDQVASERSASFLLVEYTVVAFLALSSIECLLRTWAYHRISHESVTINIFKSKGHPNGVLSWIDDLGCSVELRACIGRLYSSDDTNIRNRMLHGNLLEIHSKRREAQLAIEHPLKYGHLSRDPDPYHPENFVWHCLDCLERIDTEIAALSLNPADLDWTISIMLTAAEVDFGWNMPCDFLGPDRHQWVATVSDYLLAILPDLKQLFTQGFVQWLLGSLSVTPVLSMIMGFTYEALHRLTVHLLQGNATGLEEGTIQKSHTNANAVTHFQYRMLDMRPCGLYSPPILDILVAHLPIAERDASRKVFLLAMKARNALAHGALTQSDETTLNSIGNIFATALQNLVTGGLAHLTREAAYFIYENEHPGVHGRELDDWNKARETIQSQIAMSVQRLRLY